MLRLGSFFGPLWAGKYLNFVMLIFVLTCLLSETLFFMINPVKKKIQIYIFGSVLWMLSRKPIQILIVYCLEINN